MTKILHISKYYYPYTGGIESYARYLCLALKQKKVKQKVFCYGNEKIKVVDNINITRIKYNNVFLTQPIVRGYYRELKNIVLKFKPDIIVFHAPNPYAAKALLKCRFKGKIIIIHHSDMNSFIFKFIRLATYNIFKKIYKKSFRIFCTSQEYIDSSKELKKYIKKCFVLPTPYDEKKIKLKNDDIKYIKKIKEKYNYKKICIFIGRLVGYKGLKYALKAFKEVNNAVFLIAGDGPLKPKILECCDNNKIFYLGKLSNNDYRRYLAASDIYLFPSINRNEAYGLALLEALAAGKPCVTFNNVGSGQNWLNINNYTGFCCDMKNVNLYSAAIQKLVDNGTLRETFSKNARKNVVPAFSKSEFDAKTIKYFNV